MPANYPHLLARFVQPLAAIVLLAHASYAAAVQDFPMPAYPSATEQVPVIPPDNSTPCLSGMAHVKESVSPWLRQSPSTLSQPIVQLQPKQLLCVLGYGKPDKNGVYQWFLVIQDTLPAPWCQKQATYSGCTEYGSYPVRWLIKQPEQACQEIMIGEKSYYTAGCARGWVRRRYLGFISG